MWSDVARQHPEGRLLRDTGHVECRFVQGGYSKLLLLLLPSTHHVGYYTGGSGSGSGGGNGATRLSTYACAHVSSVTEPKSYSSLPKHLPLHTEESLEKFHPATNFTIQSLAASLVK